MRKKDRIPHLTIWLFGVIIFWLLATMYIKNIWIALLLGTNTSAFFLYMIDKLQAQAHRRRIPEKTLYLAAFLGGSGGALVAMQLFRHKTKKISFQLILAFLILIQILIGYLILQPNFFL